MNQSQDIFDRYANTYTILQCKTAKQIQDMLIHFVDGNYAKYPFSVDNMLMLANTFERNLVNLFQNIDYIGKVTGVEVLLVRSRAEEMVDFIRDEINEPVKLHFSIAQERFVNMFFDYDTKEMVSDAFRYQYSPYIMQLILALSGDQHVDQKATENISEGSKNILTEEIKAKASEFVRENLTKESYNMSNLVELFNSHPRIIYIREILLKNKDELMTVFANEVKSQLKKECRYNDA